MNEKAEYQRDSSNINLPRLQLNTRAHAQDLELISQVALHRPIVEFELHVAASMPPLILFSTGRSVSQGLNPCSECSRPDFQEDLHNPTILLQSRQFGLFRFFEPGSRMKRAMADTWLFQVCFEGLEFLKFLILACSNSVMSIIN